MLILSATRHLPLLSPLGQEIERAAVQALILLCYNSGETDS